MQPPDLFALAGYFTLLAATNLVRETAVLTSASPVASCNACQPNMAILLDLVNDDGDSSGSLTYVCQIAKRPVIYVRAMPTIRVRG